MASATVALRDALASVSIRAPRIAFATNVTGDLATDPEAIRRHLAEQVTSPVRWEDTMTAFVKLGITTYVEPAPGNVLTGLARKAAPESTSISVTTLAQLDAYA